MFHFVVDIVSWCDTLFPMNEQVMGHNIRELRLAAGLSLVELAKLAELTKGTLSKIETGQISPPISTLMRIADGMQVRLAAFFQEPEQDPPYVLTRANKGQMIAQTGSKFGYSYEALAINMSQKQAEPFLLSIKPGDPVGEFRHGGQEFIYMLCGKLALTIEDEKLELNKGDALYFDPTRVHTTKVLGKRPAKFLCVFIQNPTRIANAKKSS